MKTIKAALKAINRQFHYIWSGSPLVALILIDSISGLVKSAIHIIIHFILDLITVVHYLGLDSFWPLACCSTVKSSRACNF